MAIVKLADIVVVVTATGVAIVPVALTDPAVNTLPPALIVLLVSIFPPITLPLPVIVPNTETPVGVNTTTLPTLLTLIVTLALAVLIFKLLPPFTTLDTEVIMPVSCEPLPKI